MGSDPEGLSRLRRPSKGLVRPLEATDLPRVVDLHDRVVGAARRRPAAASMGDFQKIFLGHPWREGAPRSLVYETEDHRIVGCLGVMPRPMRFRGRKITAAVSHTYVVEPGHRGSLAGLQLAKRFLDGPQDLSIAEGSFQSRRIWESAGGHVSLLHSLSWTRPLSPSRYALSMLKNRGLSPLLAGALGPLCRAADALAALGLKKVLAPSPGRASAAPLTAGEMLETVMEDSAPRPLRPEYDAGSLSWLLETLADKGGRRRLHEVCVRGADGASVGSYVYVLNSTGVADVIEMSARDGELEPVVDHLFSHARRHGAVAVSGQVDPALFRLFSTKHCFLHHNGGTWMLVHSRHEEILHAVHRGEAYLTRLEGEWWINFVLLWRAEDGFG